MWYHHRHPAESRMGTHHTNAHARTLPLQKSNIQLPWPIYLFEHLPALSTYQNGYCSPKQVTANGLEDEANAF